MSEWKWTHEHDAAFKRIKEMATTSPLLKYYNPEDELTIECDASEKGHGAAVQQKGQPVAFASRALTDTESRYAQIEKELLAVVFALDKFEQNAYGRPVTIKRPQTLGGHCQKAVKMCTQETARDISQGSEV